MTVQNGSSDCYAGKKRQKNESDLESLGEIVNLDRIEGAENEKARCGQQLGWSWTAKMPEYPNQVQCFHGLDKVDLTKQGYISSPEEFQVGIARKLAYRNPMFIVLCPQPCQRDMTVVVHQFVYHDPLVP